MAVSIPRSDYVNNYFFSEFFEKVNQYNQDITAAFSDVFNSCDHSSRELLKLHKLFLDIRGYASRAWRTKQQNSVCNCLEDILSFLRSLKNERMCEDGARQIIYRINEIEIKHFRKSLEKRLEELERPWIFAPLGIIFQEGIDSDYKDSAIRKVMAGLSVSTTAALILLVSAIILRAINLERIRVHEQNDYVRLHDIALRSLLSKNEALRSIERKEEIQQELQNPELTILPSSVPSSPAEPTLSPAEPTSPRVFLLEEFNEEEFNNFKDEYDNLQQEISEHLISEANKDIDKINTELLRLYRSVAEIIDSDEMNSGADESIAPNSSNDNNDENNNNNDDDNGDLSQRLNSLVSNATRDRKDSQLTMANIFVFYDGDTNSEEAKLFVQVGNELLDAISTQLSSINSNYFFEDDGVDDDLSIVLFVAAFGVLGSVTSILIRVQDIDQDTRFIGSNLDGSVPTEEIDPLKPVLGGLFRPFIGAFSSLFIFAAIKSGIVTLAFLSTAGNVFYFFAVVSFVSGFSERLFVSVITKASNSFDVTQTEPKGQSLSTVLVEKIEPALQSDETQSNPSPEENSEEGSLPEEEDEESNS